MLRAHSWLWHYLWVGPNLLLLVLAILIWKRGLHRQFPAFFAFASLSAMSQLALYGADVLPSVSPELFWRVDWASLIIEGSLKFLLIAEIFAQVFGAYTSLARLGRFLISGAGIVLVMVAAVAAAYAPKSGSFGIVAGAHLLDQTIYLVESGLLVFIFLLSQYFQLSLDRPLFGIAFGLSISACVHLATWAIMANSDISNSRRSDLDFLNMATYHVSILIWYYYLALAQRDADHRPGPRSRCRQLDRTHQDHLDVWNRELERLLQ